MGTDQGLSKGYGLLSSSGHDGCLRVSIYVMYYVREGSGARFQWVAQCKILYSLFGWLRFRLQGSRFSSGDVPVSWHIVGAQLAELIGSATLTRG